MSIFWIVLGFVVVQRLAELLYAARNTAKLLSAGAREVGRGHYPLFVVLHGAWLLCLAFSVAPDQAPNWLLLGIFGVLQGGRLWVILTLGRFWTTRIITLDDQPLVRHGPFRWLRHPNYVVVVCEIAVLPAAFEAYWLALIFSLLNAALLAYRIRIETPALAARRHLGTRRD